MRAALLALVELRALQLLLARILLAAAAAELQELPGLRLVARVALEQPTPEAVAAAFRREVQCRELAALAAAGRRGFLATAVLADTIHRHPQTMLALVAVAMAVELQAETRLAQAPELAATAI